VCTDLHAPHTIPSNRGSVGCSVVLNQYTCRDSRPDRPLPLGATRELQLVTGTSAGTFNYTPPCSQAAAKGFR